MPLTTILKFLFAVPTLRAIAVFGLVLSIGGSNRLIRQSGLSVAFMAGGAAIATGLQNEEKLTALSELRARHEHREAALKTSLDVAMAESEALALQLMQMNTGLADWQTEKVLIAGQLGTLMTEEQQLLCELYETAAMEATFQAEVVQAQARIAELEASLTAKTDLATQMLTELEAEASGTFNHFTAKVSSQSKVINDLRQQIEALKKSNATLKNQKLTNRRFKTMASEHLVSNRMFDYLAKN
ncbi:MAG: hypothetical protein AAGC93_17365 [Cyanobacteria bacterium P01_F01_bin.53]